MAKKYTKKKLQALGENELLEVALKEFGIPVGDDWDADRIINEIMEAATAEQEREMEAAEKDDSERKVRIKILNGDGPDGTGDVFYGVNGRQCLAKRNEEIVVPESHYFALTVGCVQTVFDRQKDDQGIERMISREVPRFNVQFLGNAD